MAAGDLLLDTGPLVALLWPRDAKHAACVEIFKGLTGELLTTEAVVTEAMYLLARFPDGQDACLDFILRGGAIPVGMTPVMWKHLQGAMRKYRDLPMDFADATLVALAEETGMTRVFTIDRRDFGLYRTRRGRRFEVIAP